MKTLTDRSATINSALAKANEAMRRNEIVLTNLKKATNVRIN